MRKTTLLLLVAGVIPLFFVFVPVVPTLLVPCIPAIYGPDYASLSNHFLGVGAVYFPTGGLSGSYQFWTHGAIFCI